MADLTRPYKRQRRADNMPSFFSNTIAQTQFRAPPAPRVRSQTLMRPPPVVDNTSDFLSSDLDLEVSFASNVSLHSPTRESIDLTPANESCDPMDISPAPPYRTAPPVFSKPTTRPRAMTTASGSRTFGRDVSNGSSAALAPPPVPKTGSTAARKTSRAALPLEWFAAPKDQDASMRSDYSTPLLPIPSSPLSDDAMDVDTIMPTRIPAYQVSPPPLSAAPTITSFHQLFYDNMSPARPFDNPSIPASKKRRSLSPEPQRSLDADISSSPVLPSSPSERKLGRKASGTLLNRFGKPGLQGLGNPSMGTKRSRHSALSTMVHPSNDASGSTAAAEPTLRAPAPPRRAVSAMLAPTAFTMEASEDESSFDGPDMSSPAQAYSKRQHNKTVRRRDGTEDFRPLRGISTVLANEMPLSPASKLMGATGMPGFGDNEALGKVLPCHRVTDDGLMRIKPSTVDQLLNGVFDSQIAEFHIIDCRFDYEYNGGHIPGAINVNTTQGVEELLLGSGKARPKPSTSGDKAKKTILVFHCEFSMKRAPTFAKHLRAKDRAANNHVYPRIHFPEVYILEGGYCGYYKVSGPRCEPAAYVTMDDPSHTLSRREDLDQFRKARFGRTKSYAYGEAPKSSMLSQQPKRNTAPSGGPVPNPLFAAANAARTRRGGGGMLCSLEETGLPAPSDDDDTDIGDSPCPPPPVRNTLVKAKRLGRTLVRAETYAGFGTGGMDY